MLGEVVIHVRESLVNYGNVARSDRAWWSPLGDIVTLHSALSNAKLLE